MARRYAVCRRGALVAGIVGIVSIGTPRVARGGQAAAGGSQAAPLSLSGRTTQAGAVVATETAVPGATTSVDTINPTIQVQGAFAGSVRSAARQVPTGGLSFAVAIQRGLEYNLGAINLAQSVRQGRGQRTVARAALLPSIAADLAASRQTLNLAANGLNFGNLIPTTLIPGLQGFSFPTLVGPFNTMDLRARVTQTVVDLTAWNNYRASAETVRASELSAVDARELVVLGIGGAYLQAVAARARVASARAQLETANALFEQTAQRRGVGLVAQVDADRSQIQALTQQQRLTSLQNDFAKHKITLARMIGLQPTDQYDLADDIPFASAPPLGVEDALRQALAARADLKAAQAQVHAAERALAAAKAERLPSLAVNADYGAIGPTLPDARATFTVAGTLRVPLWQGGSVEGRIEQAEAVLAQRGAEFDDLASQIEGDVRNAYLDLQAASSQVEVAQKNAQVARETLELTRQRFDAGVADNVEVVQAQESVSTADLDYINGVFAHNVAKLSLARAIGQAAENLPAFLKLP